MSPDWNEGFQLGYWSGFLACIACYFVGVGVRRALDAWHNSYKKRNEK